MNQNSTISVLCILLLGLIITKAGADQPGLLNKASSPQTVTIGGVVYPVFPEGYHELAAKIEKIESQIQHFKNDKIPTVSSEQILTKRKQLEDKIRISKNEMDSLANEKDRIEKSIRENWNSLPQDLQDTLIAKIKENPNLKVYDVKDLCPDNISYMNFAKIVQEGKAIAVPYQKWNNKRIEYKRLVETLNTFENSIREKRENEIKNREAQIKKLEEELILAQKELDEKQSLYGLQMLFRVVSKVLSKHPDYNKINSEFPFDDLIVPLSELKTELEKKQLLDNNNQTSKDSQNEKENEKVLFEIAEFHWKENRPCLLNSEQARVALQFWTAIMRGNYDEAKKYASDEGVKFVDAVKSDPNNKLFDLQYHGTVILVEKRVSEGTHDKTLDTNMKQQESYIVIIAHDNDNHTVDELTARCMIEFSKKNNEKPDENKNDTQLPDYFPIKITKVNDAWKADIYFEK